MWQNYIPPRGAGMKENRNYPLRDGVSCRKPGTLAGHNPKSWQQALLFAFWSLISVMLLFKECWDRENIKPSPFIQEGSPAAFHIENFKQRGRRSRYYSNHLVSDGGKTKGELQVKYKNLDKPNKSVEIKLWIKLCWDSLLGNETNRIDYISFALKF